VPGFILPIASSISRSYFSVYVEALMFSKCPVDTGPIFPERPLSSLFQLMDMV